jgi:hypothetical protein
MTPARLRWCLAVIGWTQRYYGRRINRREDYILALCRGRKPIPPWIAEHIEALAAAHHAHIEPHWPQRTVAAAASDDDCGNLPAHG